MTVSIGSSGKHRNDIRLRWRYLGKRYSLCIGKRTQHNIKKAKIKAAEIEHDLETGEFDTSLHSYRLDEDYANGEAKDYGGIVKRYHNWASLIRQQEFGSSHYLYIKRLLQRWGSFRLKDVPMLLSREKYSVSTYNARLANLKLFFKWMVTEHYIRDNPLESVQRRKTRSRSMEAISPKRKPLSLAEIRKLLDAFLTNKYCSKYSQPKHSYYYPFLKFMFLTGVRPAEAIGLKSKYVDLESGQITIAEVLARTNDGSHAAARVFKETKSGKKRVLPITPELELILKPLVGKPEQLVFQSPRGTAINDHMFQRRILRPVMAKLGIADRVLYSTRHSFGTHAIDQGISVVDVASLMGHATIRTTIDNYVKTLKVPDRMPNLSTESVALNPVGSRFGSHEVLKQQQVVSATD